jgi:membrane-bound ClpP family serine protease
MGALVWVGALLLAGLAVMVLEVFVPSGGVLGFLSVVAIVAAIVTAFAEQGVAFGMAVLATACVAVPAVLAVAFRWFPETPLGRRVLPPPPAPDDVLPGAEGRRRLRGFVGRRGAAVTELLPWGRVLIDGETFEALSEAGAIPAAAAVEAVGVEGAALVVRAAGPEAAAGRPESAAQRDSREPLAGSRALEEFDFDGLDPPVA